MNVENIRKTVAVGAVNGINESSLNSSFQCERCINGKSCKQPHTVVPGKEMLKFST